LEFLRKFSAIVLKALGAIFFDFKDIVHKESILVGQAVNSAYYCGVLQRLRENVRRIRLELWRRKNWLLHHDNASSNISFVSREF
jgi:hypothetical protein